MIRRERQNTGETLVRNNPALGPYSTRVLNNLGSADAEVKAFANRFNQHFLWLDTVDSLFQARLNTGYQEDYFEATKEPAKGSPDFIYMRMLIGVRDYDEETISSTVSGHREAINEVLSLVLNGNRQSQFRGFILDHFDEVVDALSPFSPFYKYPNLREYNPARSYQRLVTLFNAASEEDREFLARYVGYTKHCERRFVAPKLDDEILDGHPTRAKVFTEFLDKGREHRDSFEIFEYDAMNDYINEYLEGNINEEEFLYGLEEVVTIKAVIDTLPAYYEDRFFLGRLEDIYRERDKLRALEIILASIELPQPLISHLIYGSEENKEEIDQVISNFSRALDPILEFSDQFFSRYMAMYFSGEIDSQALDEVTESVKALTAGILSDGEEPLYGPFGTTLKGLGRQLEFVLASPDYLQQVPTVLELLRNGILPTRKILDFMRDREEQALEELVRLRIETAQGNFDPTNESQKELECSTYFRLTQGMGLDYRRTFEGLEYVQNIDLPRLNTRERRIAKAEVYGMAIGYHFIKRLVDRGKVVDMIINPPIGYQRMGSRRFAEVLGWDLERIGVNILPSAKGKAYLRQRDPDYFIMVDVTANPYPFSPMGPLNTGIEPRLHSELLPYLHWLREIAVEEPERSAGLYYWTPEVTSHSSEIHFARQVIKPFHEANIPSKAIILLNPTVRDSRLLNNALGAVSYYSPAGYFNNLDELLELPEEIVFTPYGVKALPRVERTPQQLNELIESHMANVLPHMLEITDPISM